MIIPIILTGLLVCFLPFYIRTEYIWPAKKYFYTKVASSILFVSIGVSALIVTQTPLSYSAFIVAALVLGLIGDAFLVYDKNPKFFMLGLVTFLLGQIVYGTVFLSVNGFMWYDLIIYAVMLSAVFIVYPKTNVELGEMKKPVLLYYIIILYMFTMAVSSIYKGGFNTLTTIFVASGAFLFLLSDVILTFNLFDKNAPKSTKAWVLITYYAAQSLLALSILTYMN